MKAWFAGLALCLLVTGGAHAADGVPLPPVDYAPASSWLCRPDNAALCSTGLDAVAVSNDGTRTPQPFIAAADPKIDCFYVYPTVSAEPTPLADMVAGDAERRTVKAQAARLASRCRVFAPIYRQITLTGLRARLATGASVDEATPYADVLNAWRWYLANANHGRGVVLIGHSQGTIILQKLIAAEIDGKPVEKRIVSIFLAGDPGLAVPVGAAVGGAFKRIPLCAAARQTGCAYVWSSYLASDAAPQRAFGRNPGGGLVAGCVSPAAPGGGSGELKAILTRPSLADPNDPPWVAVRGQLTGECVADATGNVVRVTVVPGRYAALLTALFEAGSIPGWGLHRFDVSLEAGNILDVIDAEIAGWRG